MTSSDLADNSGATATELTNEQAVELVLAEFRAVLENPELTEEDHFFESGGDSILAAKAVRRLHEATGLEIANAFVYTYPTAEELGEVLAETSQFHD